MTIDLQNTGLVRLDRGAMQNWSDLSEVGATASAAMRALVADLVGESDRVLVVGPTAMDIVTELAQVAAELTVVSRSIPDCAAYGEALVNATNVSIVCGDLLNIEHKIPAHDVVLVMEDLARVPSLEDTTPTWDSVFDAVRACLVPGGKLLMAVENELGLHRITSLRSRYTENDNGAWDVISTFDASRPRTREALHAKLSGAQLGDGEVVDVLPTWDDHTLLVRHADTASASGRLLVSALTLSSPALRRLGADPTRVTRAAVMADRVLEMSSGWLVVVGAPSPEHRFTVEASTTTGRTLTFVDTGEGRIESAGTAVKLPADGALFGEAALDACASGDAARFRALVRRWWDFAQGAAREGSLEARTADLRFDNLIELPGGGFVQIAPADEAVSLDRAAWSAIVDLVSVIRARGARHLWPAATDDRTMAATIGAMAGVPASENLDQLIGARETQLGLPASDVSGLLAVIERLEEKNKALASRANWFENRLSQRERELRGRAQRQAAELALAGRQQEALRKSAEDIRRSLTYRLGNVAMGPLKEAKKRIMP